MADKKTQDSVLLDQVDRILKQQGPRKRWGQREHVAFIANLVEYCLGSELVGKDEKTALKELLDEHGAGGNASQFRQWLASKEGGQRIPTAEQQLAEYE